MSESVADGRTCLDGMRIERKHPSDTQEEEVVVAAGFGVEDKSGETLVPSLNNNTHVLHSGDSSSGSSSTASISSSGSRGDLNTNSDTAFIASLLTPQNMCKLLGYSVGYEKYWLPGFCLQIVEDDGLRSSLVRLRECVLPLRFALDPRAERGRKKVASKGDRVLHGRTSSKLLMRAADAAAAATEAPAAAAAAASVAVDGVTTTASPAAAGGGPVSAAAPHVFAGAGGSESSMRFVGELSRSDRGLIETLKRCVLAKNPSFLSLDNRSLVAKVNSKSKLPVLWLRADPTQMWIARVRRCQSGSMWGQQLLNDTNIYAQLEAAAALGYLPAFEEGAESLTDGGSAASVPAAALSSSCGGGGATTAPYSSAAAESENLPVTNTVTAAADAAATTIVVAATTIVAAATTIIAAAIADDRMQQLLAGVPSGAYLSDAALAAAGTAGAGEGGLSLVCATVAAPPSLRNGAAAAAFATLRLAETAASTPEIRFLLHFYAAASLLRDYRGM
ncbi:LOW QUALITY PROTEIN: uncharacterized protein LOC131478817 [Ochotona princeps]|uniref:LOW QUALITY PROTEIN: uncharacterized protein LOC131478817 n=1 Tax=Ochotona princeps TaxID=9978 RepID=UPI002714E14B|nr:LOW QUALITY PROTEIN: uncharacterized protein LOC131478817 [Ochotona princeps]